jgi:predicted acylesterase/phospholipase RssA
MRIEMDHLLASCGFLREFAPVEIGGRLFGDGGRLSTQAWKARPDSDLVLYVVDLYPLDGGRPKSLEAAAERKNDLLFRQSNCPQAETSYSVAERLAAGNVPFAFVTGYGEFGIKAEFRDRPVISKPLNEVNLAATLRLMRPA